MRFTPTTLAERIRDWDEAVEEAEITDEYAPRKPFDAGIMLAVASLFDAWDTKPPHPELVDPRLVQAVKALRETAEEVIGG